VTVEAIRLQNFMAFQDTGWVELRPITLLFGRNSSGKSVLIRALLLLKQSLRCVAEDQPFVFFDPYGVDVGGFREIVHNGEEDRHIWFHFRCSSSAIQDALERLRKLGIISTEPSLPAVLQLVLCYAARREAPGKIDSSWIDLANLQIRLGADDQGAEGLLFQAGLLEPEDIDRFEGERWYVEGLLAHDEREGVWRGFDCRLDRGFLDFKFTVPQVGAFQGYNAVIDLFSLLKQEVESFLRGIVHLGPIRPMPQRRYSFDRAAEREWTARDWTAFLDFIGGKMGQEETSEINAWLKRLQLAVAADPRPTSESGALVAERELAIAESEGLVLPLSAMGFGTAQVLPVIVQCIKAKPGSLVIVEQPELHLHPRAQAEIGDLFLMKALGRKHDNHALRLPCFLLETHSEHIILRLMRRMRNTVRNELPEQIPETSPEHVGVYVVDRHKEERLSTIHLMELGVEGQLLEPWPGGFFEEDFVERFA